jgi:hypothetical protein
MYRGKGKVVPAYCITPGNKIFERVKVNLLSIFNFCI